MSSTPNLKHINAQYFTCIIQHIPNTTNLSF